MCLCAQIHVNTNAKLLSFLKVCYFIQHCLVIDNLIHRVDLKSSDFTELWTSQNLRITKTVQHILAESCYSLLNIESNTS